MGTWDPQNQHDTARHRDRILEETLLEKRFEVLNDGAPTRTSSDADIRQSAIDITAAHPQWAGICTWAADRAPITDRHTIVTTIIMNHGAYVNHRKRWFLKKANWKKFRASIDTFLRLQDSTNANIEQQNRSLTAGILKAARQSVPRGRRAKEVPWWTDEVQVCIRKRKSAWEQLRRENKEDAKEHLAKMQQEATTAIHAAKRETWKEPVESLTATSPEGQLWRILKGMDRRQKPFQPKTLGESECRADNKKADLRRFISSSKRGAKDTTHRNAFRTVMDKARRRYRGSHRDAFTKKELEAVLRKLKKNKAGGPDNIQSVSL